MNEIRMFEKPLEIRKRLSESGAEMSEWQLSLLCGLIKKYRPKKIVEIGVAAGGTTAIILNCIAMLELEAEVYSVDISENYYRDTSKKTGYLIEECKNFLGTDIKHKIYTEGITKCIDIIGENIDFLILDTTHSLPGELLDFLVCFPKLRDGALVALHDIILNHLNPVGAINSFATKVLLCSVAGKRITCKGDSNPWGCSGIGIFKITKDTGKYIGNVFSSLTITWGYMPERVQLEQYRNCLSKYYSNELMYEFDNAIRMNEVTLIKKKHENKEEFCSMYELVDKLKNKKNIFIYGCGVYGIKLYDFLENVGIRIEGFVISDNQTKPCINKRIEYFSDVKRDESTFVLGMSLAKQKEICKEDVADDWIRLDEHVLNYLKNNC